MQRGRGRWGRTLRLLGRWGLRLLGRQSLGFSRQLWLTWCCLRLLNWLNLGWSRWSLHERSWSSMHRSSMLTRLGQSTLLALMGLMGRSLWGLGVMLGRSLLDRMHLLGWMLPLQLLWGSEMRGWLLML